MAIYQIPLTPVSQKLKVKLNGTVYGLIVKWNVAAQNWVIDITDVNDVLLITGLALVANTDLLAPFKEFKFGGMLYAYTDNSPLDAPTLTNLGVNSQLYFETV